jgi:hypothetical protein
MSNNYKKLAKEQNNVTGQRKEVDVQDYPSAIELANALKDINYPSDKNTIMSFVNRNNTDSKIIQCLEKIEDKQYTNSSEVVSGTGLVSH